MSAISARALLLSLAEGGVVELRVRGNSMTPLIHSGDLVTLDPLDASWPLASGEVVLVRVAGRLMLHLVQQIDGHGLEQRVLIANNHGHINGWTSRRDVYARLIRVKPGASADGGDRPPGAATPLAL